MSAVLMLTAIGAISVTAAMLWWTVRRVRQWRAMARLRRVQAHYAGLRAELVLGYERIYTRCAARPAWSAQKLADMEWAFAQIDGVLERRRLDEVAEVGRLLPPVGPPVAPVVLGVAGAIAVVIASVVAW